jgi:hypothetical protein
VSGSSNVRVVTSISDGLAVCSYVSGEPQDPQNRRVTGALEWNATGSPRRKRNLRVPNVTHATAGAPDARAHELQ